MSNHPTQTYRNRSKIGAYEKLHGAIGSNKLQTLLGAAYTTILSGSSTDPTDVPSNGFIIDRLRIRGITRVGGVDPGATVVDTITIRLTDGITTYDMPFACWTDAGPVSRTVDIDWDIGGQIGLPSGWIMRANVDNVQVGGVHAIVEAESTSDRTLLSAGIPTARLGLAFLASGGGGHTATTTETSGLVANAHIGKRITMTSGVNKGQSRPITANTTTVITHSAFTAANSDGDSFTLLGEKAQFWAGGIKVANNTPVLIAGGIDGKCIEIRGIYVLGQGVGAENSLELLAGHDTGKLFSIGKFHVNATNVEGRVNKGSGSIRIAIPPGMHLYGRNNNAGACLGSIAAFGGYVDGLDYVDLTGRHNYHGTATAGGVGTTLTDATHSAVGNPWLVNEWAGYPVRIVSGDGAGQTRTIVSNSATVLTVDTAWSPATALGSVYEINPQYEAAPIQKTAFGPGHLTTATETTNLTDSGHVGWSIRMLTGVNAGISRSISANTTTVITHAAFSTANSDGDLFVLVPGQVSWIEMTKLDKASGIASGGAHAPGTTNTTGLVTSALVGKYIRMNTGPNAGKLQRITANTTTAITHDSFVAGANADGNLFDIMEAKGRKNHSGSKWWAMVTAASFTLVIRSPFSLRPTVASSSITQVAEGVFGGGGLTSAPGFPAQVGIGFSDSVADLYYVVATISASATDPLTEVNFLDDNLWISVMDSTLQRLTYGVSAFDESASVTLWGRLLGQATDRTSFRGV